MLNCNKTIFPLLLLLQGAVSSSLTCLQLHKRAERVAALLMERGGLQEGDHVALVYPPGQREELSTEEHLDVDLKLN